MCLQCLANAELVLKRPVLPKLHGDCMGGPYWLVQAQKGCKEWPKGWYGLVQMNDPDFIWPFKPTPEPSYRKVDEKAWREWEKNIGKVERAYSDHITSHMNDPIKGYQFVAACMQAGYRPEKNGYRVMMWFMNRLGRIIARQRKITP